MMDQIHDSALEKTVHEYLLGIGYSPESIRPGPLVDVGGRRWEADMIIMQGSEPWLAIDIKGRHKFPNLKEVNLLRYDSSVRQLQAYAGAINAPFYLLTDGHNFLWFTTDPLGRPQLIEEPVRPKANISTTQKQDGKEAILQSFRSLQYFLQRVGGGQRTNEAPLVILAKLLQERGDNSLVWSLDLEGSTRNHERFPIPESYAYAITMEEFARREYLRDAFAMISSISFMDSRPEDLLTAFDEVFLNVISKEYNPRVPRWLADFLVRLAHPGPESIILDLNAGYGDVLAAVAIVAGANNDLATWGYSRLPTEALWSQIQQLVVGQEADRVLLEDPLISNNLEAKEVHKFPSPTHIITAPSFGARVDPSIFMPRSTLMHRGIRQKEDLFIEQATMLVKSEGRIVMLVPESLLFSQNREATRSFVHDHLQIVAIISLSSGMQLPYSRVKTSILVLDKRQAPDSANVFMAHIEGIGGKEPFNSRQVEGIRSVLEDFEYWEATKNLSDDASAWLVPQSKITLANWTANHYRPLPPGHDQNLFELYPLVRLGDVAVIKRGVSIKLSDNGDVPVIGPGAIRPFDIDPAGFGHTSQEQLPARAFMPAVGDIVLNNIGQYLGAAALINPETARGYISQHVILIHSQTTDVLAEFLVAALNSGYVRPQVQKMATGAVMPTLSISALADITIPIPDLETQERIATTVRSSRNNVQRAKEELVRAEAELVEVVHQLASRG